MRQLQAYLEVEYPLIIIQVEGTTADDITARVTKFEYQDNFTKADMVRLDLIDPDSSLINDDRMTVDTAWDFRWGYPTDISNVRRLLLKYFEPNYGTEGVPTISCVFLGKVSDLHRVKKSTNWGHVSTTTIARKIAKRHGLAFKGEESNDILDESYIQPGDLSDWEYLQQLAFESDFEVSIEQGTLYYRSNDTARNEAPRLSLVWYGDKTPTYLKTFKPRIRSKFSKVKHRGVSTKTGDRVTATSTNKKNTPHVLAGNPPTQKKHPIDPDAIPPPAGDSITINQKTESQQSSRSFDLKTGIQLSSTQVDDAADHVSNTGLTNDKATTHATSIKRDFLDKTVFAEIEMIGTPRFKCRTNCEVIGVDRRLSGVWYVTGCTHTVSPGEGYTISGELHRGAYKAKKKDKTGNNTVNDKAAGSQTKGAGGLQLNLITGDQKQVSTTEVAMPAR
jgi:phage protein D